MTEVTRHPDHVTVSARGREPERFDAVVIATHSDQALALLGRPQRARARAARGDPLSAQRGGAAHRPLAASAAPARVGELELPSRRRCAGALHGDLPPEPPAVAARRPRVLRHAQPHGRRSTRSGSSARCSMPTPSTPPRASPRRRATTRSAGATARTTAAPTGDGASTRTACSSALRVVRELERQRDGAGEAYDGQRDLRGHDPPPALRGAPPRVPPPLGARLSRPRGAGRPARRPAHRRPAGPRAVPPRRLPRRSRHSGSQMPCARLVERGDGQRARGPDPPADAACARSATASTRSASTTASPRRSSSRRSWRR